MNQTIKHWRGLGINLFATVLLTSCAVTTQAAIPPAENLMPSDTFVLLTVPDWNALLKASQVSPQLRFWNDPAMKPFHDKVMDKLSEQFIAPLEQNLGMKLADFEGLPQGQVSVGITINGSNGNDDIPPGVILLMDAKDKSDELTTNLTRLTKKWQDAGRTLRTDNIHGLNFNVITLTTNDLASVIHPRPPVSQIGQEPKPMKPLDVYYTQYKSLLVVGNTRTGLDALVAHLTGGNIPALSDNPTFAADKLQEFRDTPTYYGWFDAGKFFSLIQNSGSDQDSGESGMAQAFAAGKMISVVGLGGLKSASLALREGQEGSTMTVHLDAPMNERTGLMALLAVSPKDANPPTFVPEDVVKFSRIRLDGKQAWATLQKIIGLLSPNGASYLNSVIDLANTSAQQKDPSFDLRHDLFGNLGDDIVSYQKAPVGDSLQALASAPELTLVAVANPEQVMEAIRVISGMVLPQETAPAPQDFMGHKIYSIAMRSKRAADGTAIPTAPLLLSASGGYVAFSLDTGIMEAYLRSADGKVSPLAEKPGLREAAATIGGMGEGIFGYQDQQQSMRSSFKLLKGAQGSDPEMRMLPPSVRSWLDFSLLPDFDSVAKYFYISVYNGMTTDDGMTYKVFTPRPPALN